MCNLLQLRKEKNISANKLAKLCGVTRQQISNLEHGKNGMSVSLAKKIAGVLGVSWTVFFDEDNCPNEKQN